MKTQTVNEQRTEYEEQDVKELAAWKKAAVDIAHAVRPAIDVAGGYEAAVVLFSVDSNDVTRLVSIYFTRFDTFDVLDIGWHIEPGFRHMLAVVRYEGKYDCGCFLESTLDFYGLGLLEGALRVWKERQIAELGEYPGLEVAFIGLHESRPDGSWTGGVASTSTALDEADTYTPAEPPVPVNIDPESADVSERAAFVAWQLRPWVEMKPYMDRYPWGLLVHYAMGDSGPRIRRVHGELLDLVHPLDTMRGYQADADSGVAFVRYSERRKAEPKNYAAAGAMEARWRYGRDAEPAYASFAEEHPELLAAERRWITVGRDGFDSFSVTDVVNIKPLRTQESGGLNHDNASEAGQDRQG